MTLIDVLLLLLIAGICGSLGQAIAGYSRGGCLVSIALGFVGALLGMWLARMMGLPELCPLLRSWLNYFSTSPFRTNHSRTTFFLSRLAPSTS